MLPSRPSKRSRIEASQPAQNESSASAIVIPPQATRPVTDEPGLSGGDEEEKQQEEDAAAAQRRLRFWYPGYMACQDESDEVTNERADWEESDKRSDGLDDTTYSSSTGDDSSSPLPSRLARDQAAGSGAGAPRPVRERHDDDSEEVTCTIMTMPAAICNEDSSSDPSWDGSSIGDDGYMASCDDESDEVTENAAAGQFNSSEFDLLVFQLIIMEGDEDPFNNPVTCPVCSTVAPIVSTCYGCKRIWCNHVNCPSSACACKPSDPKRSTYTQSIW